MLQVEVFRFAAESITLWKLALEMNSEVTNKFASD
jgi:hypothetical protein